MLLFGLAQDTAGADRRAFQKALNQFRGRLMAFGQAGKKDTGYHAGWDWLLVYLGADKAA